MRATVRASGSVAWKVPTQPRSSPSTWTVTKAPRTSASAPVAGTGTSRVVPARWARMAPRAIPSSAARSVAVSGVMDGGERR